MAYDKLVDSSALDSNLGDVADAIRAKSGGSSQLAFPSGFISEIENISTGGGTKVLTKLAEYTIAEPVATFSITATEQMQSCGVLYIVADLVLSASDWIYPTINTSGINMGYFNKTSNLRESFGLAHLDTAKNAVSRFVYVSELNNLHSVAQDSLSSIIFKLYTSGVTFNSGTIEIWGYV